MPEEIINPWCLSLPQDMCDERDFKAEEAIKVDENIELPESFSLWKWIWETNYQWAIGSCTANSTSHWVQILAVAKWWEIPFDKNIITPDWKDLWRKMGHNPEKYEWWWDYVEKAVDTALKEWILSIEKWEIIKFDAYCTMNWNGSDENIIMMKRYLYQTNPIVRCMKGNKNVWNQLSLWQLTKWIKLSESTWAHAICLVWWDKEGFWFVNSWLTNDWLKRKSRFHVPYNIMKQYSNMFNWRMWVLYSKIDALKDPDYLKKKSNALIILKALRKMYDEESMSVKNSIVKLSIALRDEYPELNDEYPVE